MILIGRGLDLRARGFEKQKEEDAEAEVEVRLKGKRSLCGFEGAESAK